MNMKQTLMTGIKNVLKIVIEVRAIIEEQTAVATRTEFNGRRKKEKRRRKWSETEFQEQNLSAMVDRV